MTLNPKQPIRVLIVDDHPSIRRGLKYMVSVADDIECVGEGDNGDRADSQLIYGKSDVSKPSPCITRCD